MPENDALLTAIAGVREGLSAIKSEIKGEFRPELLMELQRLAAEIESLKGKASTNDDKPLALASWTGHWALERRENWDEWLAFNGVPEGSRAAASKAPDFHKYRVTSSAFTLEHEIPVQKQHLLFCADLDGKWHPSPYPKPTVQHWSEAEQAKMSVFRNLWLEEPVKFRTEFPDWAGKNGNTMRLDRHLISNDTIEMTVHILVEDEVVVGPCKTYMKRTSEVGPQPIAWLRSRGKSLGRAEDRMTALECMKKLVQENMDDISAAHEVDRVFPSKFSGVGGMILHGLAAYKELVEPFMAPEPLRDCSPAMLWAGIEAEYSVMNEPKGVCVNISPWNAPVQLSLIPIMAMLASGNHAILKPPDMVPTVSALLRRLCQKYLHGYVWVEEGGKETVERLIDEGSDHLVFTGGGEIAKSVAVRCAKQLTPVTLELGGKSPVFIDGDLSDAMISDAVRETLQLKVVKTGQFCCAHDYLLVHEAAHTKLIAKLTAELVALGEKRNVHVIGRRQYQGLKRKFEEAEPNAKCVPPMEGACVFDDAAMSIPMTCLLDPPPDCELMTREIFGPLLPIVKVKDVDEAIAHVRRMPTGKPLIAYCYTESAATADAFIAGTSSGNVAVNGGPQRMLANTDVSFGGVGSSGSGVSLWGVECMREFTNRKHVMRAKSGFAKSFFSGPPRKESREGAEPCGK